MWIIVVIILGFLALIEGAASGSGAEIILGLVIAVPVIAVFIWGAKMSPEEKKEIEKQMEANRKESEKREQAEIQAERIAAVRSQNDTTPWAVRYMTSPCPHCGHYKVRFGTWDDKKMDVAFWGIASTELGKTYICDHCKKTW